MTKKPNPNPKPYSRRAFIEKSSLAALCSLASPSILAGASPAKTHFFKKSKPTAINAHLWVYASQFPPHWDCTPILETVFSDLSYAGIDGLELMEGQLRHEDSVIRLKGLIEKHQLGVSGSSYGVGFSMWDASQKKKILDDIKLVVPRLGKIGGKTFGISVGQKTSGLKTAAELDTQAALLSEIRHICQDHGIVANLHNHTYEVENNMYDLKGTLERLPDFKLGPDLNWLIRAGVNPVDFINEYGSQIVYLHIRDQDLKGVWTEYVGQGNTDFKSIAAALKEQKFSGELAIELAFPEQFIPKNSLAKDWELSRLYVQQTFD